MSVHEYVVDGVGVIVAVGYVGGAAGTDDDERVRRYVVGVAVVVGCVVVVVDMIGYVNDVDIG